MYANRLVCETTCMQNDRLPFSVGNAKDLRRGVLNFAAYWRGISVFRVQQQEMKSTYGITLACTFIPAGAGILVTTRGKVVTRVFQPIFGS